MKEEVWKPVEGWKGYEVSNTGKVRSYLQIGCKRTELNKPQRILKQEISNKGYYVVTLRQNKLSKRCAVHRLIAEAFLPKQQNVTLVVNHKNGIKTDNSVENLEWCTQSENVKHSYKMGLQDSKRFQKKVKKIDLTTGKVIAVYDSVKDASKTIGDNISIQQNIGRVCNKIKHYKQAYGYKWEWA